jgi:hypothetical protein
MPCLSAALAVPRRGFAPPGVPLEVRHAAICLPRRSAARSGMFGVKRPLRVAGQGKALNEFESHLPIRRTQRVQISMPVMVRGHKFQENTSTVAVNAHGCLVLLKAIVQKDQEIFLINPKTAEELPGRVVSLGKPEEGKTPVAVEFAEASPLFWRINFPPEDWFTSAERKRPGASGNAPRPGQNPPASTAPGRPAPAVSSAPAAPAKK